jgi:hypothetical protein
MNKLAEIRNQEMMCRERALLDTDRRAFWLARADEWAQRANDEIASLFRESVPPHEAKTPHPETFLCR